MANDSTMIGSELGSVPVGELIRSMAMAIADAQFELDKSALRVSEFMSGQRLLRPEELPAGSAATSPQLVDTRVYFGYGFDQHGQRVPQKVSMMELGFVPTFYQFVDTVIEVKLALKLQRSGQTESQGPGSAAPGSRFVLAATPVDASYASTYSFSADMAAVFRTKLVPIPPPALLEQRIRSMLEAEARSTAPPAAPAPNPTNTPTG